MTQLLELHPTHPQKRLLDMAAKALHTGELVVYPNETGYAVACHLGDKGALEQLIALRRLPKEHQFTLICRDLSELGSYARVENSAYRILKRNTPGAFTFVLPATKEVPRRLVHPKKKTIGLRVPEHPVATGLLEAMGEPLLSTTLKLPDLPDDEATPRDPQDIAAAVDKRVAFVLGCGMGCDGGSTIVDFTTDEPHITQQGTGELL
ncbi:MAG: threonylcarbamoyl-AMP synthase [Pseudomonadales bacterium]|nr:threonylcarbamoyl-AMP synthase [Pseudomonadales bacterium]